MRLLEPRSGRLSPPLLCVVVLLAVGLAACGSNSTSAPTAGVASIAPSSHSPSASPPLASGPTRAPSPASVPSAAAGSVEVCALLTTAEVAEILGAESVQTRQMPGVGAMAGQCAWNSLTNGFFIGVGTPASLAASGGPAADAQAKLEEYQGTAEAPETVVGIGDGAVMSSNGIAAYLGGSYIEVTNLGLTKDQLIKILKLAILRL